MTDEFMAEKRLQERFGKNSVPKSETNDKEVQVKNHMKGILSRMQCAREFAVEPDTARIRMARQKLRSQ